MNGGHGDGQSFDYLSSCVVFLEISVHDLSTNQLLVHMLLVISQCERTRGSLCCTPSSQSYDMWCFDPPFSVPVRIGKAAAEQGTVSQESMIISSPNFYLGLPPCFSHSISYYDHKHPQIAEYHFISKFLKILKSFHPLSLLLLRYVPSPL